MNYEFPNIDQMSNEELNKWFGREMFRLVANKVDYSKLQIMLKDSSMDNDKYIVLEKFVKILSEMKDKIGFDTIDQMFESYRKEQIQFMKEFNASRQSSGKNRLS